MNKRELDKLERFIRSSVMHEPKAVRIALMQIIGAGRDNKLCDWPLSSESGSVDCAALARECLQMAYEDAEGYGGGRQRYKLVAIEEAGFAFARSPIIAVQPEASTDDSGESDEPSNEGLLVHFMRHSEQMFRITMTSAIAGQKVMSETVERLGLQVDRLLQEKFDSIAVMESLASERSHRDIEEMREKAKISRQERLFEQGQILLPAVVNRIKGGVPLLPEKRTPLMDMLMRLFGTLDAKQIDVIFNTLSLEQKTGFAEAYEAFKAMSDEERKKMAEEQAKKGEANGTSTSTSASAG